MLSDHIFLSLSMANDRTGVCDQYPIIIESFTEKLIANLTQNIYCTFSVPDNMKRVSLCRNLNVNVRAVYLFQLTLLIGHMALLVQKPH